ncbi:helix-turn-helix domain-containing protein [Rhodoblastus sp.]|jgi:CRP/FNR family transcriptional activator FtrB|uniref:helix-turn-helix domain-containing protein n=1 Tax=Rhodoblastus sp. TaxID=1962975 RepID=UPI0026332C2B|nr:helix-turn-helix domain-containing protein [Rhodoblastus sp.]
MLSRQQYEEASRLQIFSGCRPETIAMLLEGAFLHRFPERIDLAKEAETPDFLHVVISGAVELYAHYRDRETTIEVIGPPNSFITAAVVLDLPNLKSARVIEPAKILMLPAASVRKALNEDAAFAARIATELATAYRYITKDLKNQKLRSSLERLANWLVRRDRESGSRHRVVIPFEKRVLAAQLGMVPENLSRGFATLARFGVKVKGSALEIHDPQALENLAKPDPLIDDPSS